jgi:hypothetical protein
VREFFFALNKNTTTTRDNDPLTPLFLFFLLRESSRIFLLTQPQGLKDQQLHRKKAEETTAEKNTKNSKKYKNFVVTREIFPAPSSSSSSSSSSSNVAAAGAKRKEEKEREIYHLCFVSSIRSRTTNTHQRQRALTIQRQQINNNKT